MTSLIVHEIMRVTGLSSSIADYIGFNGRYRPAMLICETVNICNNNCIVCAYSYMKRTKTTMSCDLFDKVLKSYSEMGGGCLSLTPVVGDVLLDKYLIDRIKIARKYENITSISFTTNAIMAGDLPVSSIKYITNNVNKIMISIYGIDQEEYKLMTRTDNYHKMVDGVNRILSSVEDCSKIELGFRLLKNRSDHDFDNWIINNLKSKNIKHHKVTKYANWNILDTSTKLPFDAEWLDNKFVIDHCLIPVIALQVFSNGDISYCPCDDYDRVPEFHLGNIVNMSLLDMCNSEKYHKLIDLNSAVPRYCRKCTFHMPMSSINEHKHALNDPVSFIGG